MHIIISENTAVFGYLGRARLTQQKQKKGLSFNMENMTSCPQLRFRA